MATHWIPATRADLGLSAGDLPASTLTVTNRAWYLLHQFVASAGGRSTEVMAGRDVYVPVALAQHWGAVITAADGRDWLQVGRFNGVAVVACGITRRSEAGIWLDTHELTPLSETPLHAWLSEIGMQLSITPTGLVITSRPNKENPMSVNLTKGGKTNLTKEAGGTLAKARLGLGWDVRRTSGPDYDLDASVIAVGADGKSIGADWFVFYGNLRSPGQAIVHHGDNLTGKGDGDDEQISIDLAALPASVQELVVAVTIYQAKQRGGQNFGLVENAFIRIVDDTSGTELARFDLTEGTDNGVNCLVFGKLYRREGDWNFRALGEGFTDELGGLLAAYGVNR